ncbi:MAG: AAA family ATPase [Candidatus Brocadia sp.]|nr:AAA family ATPase [Candidatus Brocadia sp.]
MYYEYWGLSKPPFDNVPDPTMYAECHASMESAIAETMFAIEEGEDCVAVIIGDVGLGKTTSLRIIIDSLQQGKYKIALITNPSTTFVQIMRETIGQLTGKQCEEKRKVDLLEIFNKLLFDTIDEGKKVLIFIDEANAISSANLENLRLLTNMQDDRRNLFTLVLAGQIELARRLEHPKLTNLFQRIGTYNRINKLQSEDLIRTYVETRLKLAGGTREIFKENSFKFLWEYSEHGVPRLINKICKLSLKAGETNKFNEIDAEVVRQIGERFQKMHSPATQKRITKKSSKEKIFSDITEEVTCISDANFIDRGNGKPVSVPEEDNHTKPVLSFKEKECNITENSKDGGEKELKPDIEPLDTRKLATVPTENNSRIQESSSEIEIEGSLVKIDFPSHIIQQAQFSTQENRTKLAGVMAAQTLKENPQLIKSPSADPVSVWCTIRDFVLSRITQEN